jgi:hypothetical protein
MNSFLHGSIIERDFMGRPHVDLEESTSLMGRCLSIRNRTEKCAMKQN